MLRCDGDDDVAAVGGAHQADIVVQDRRRHHLVDGAATRVGQFAGSIKDNITQCGDAVRASVVVRAVAAATEIGTAREEEVNLDDIVGQAQLLGLEAAGAGATNRVDNDRCAVGIARVCGRWRGLDAQSECTTGDSGAV